ncbi:MAG: flagellar type III secretion system pore protein FliP [Oceanococcus sp.]
MKLLAFVVLFAPLVASAAGLPAITVEPSASGGQSYSLSLQVLAAMTAVTMLPAILLSMTAFPRIIIVLGLLRSALGTGQTPSNQILVGLGLMLSFFVMGPVLDRMYAEGVKPYLDDQMEMSAALTAASIPLREFMLMQTRESSLISFAEMDGGEAAYDDAAEVPMRVLVPAFVTSELTTAFQIGFLLFIPFVVIDLVISSVLMSMGMMMLSPMLISLPFKIMLFVMVDGWTLVVGSLATSFGI